MFPQMYPRADKWGNGRNKEKKVCYVAYPIPLQLKSTSAVLYTVVTTAVDVPFAPLAYIHATTYVITISKPRTKRV